jgi:HlyD family secretion protein
MQVLVMLNEVDRPFVKVGQKAEITIEAYSDTVFTGTVSLVSRIVNQMEDANNLKTYDVIIHIDSKENYRMKPGLSAEVRLFLNTVGQYFSVPSFCLFGEEKDFYIESLEQGEIDVDVREIRDGLAYIEGEKLSEGLKILTNPDIPVF